MRYLLLSIVLTLVSCKTESKKVAPNFDCPLSELSKTVNYRNEFRKFENFLGDSIIQFDNKKIKNFSYQTIFDLRGHEQYVWLIRYELSKTKIDSFLIHYEDIVEYYLLIETKFDLDKCEFITTETENHSIDGEEEITIKRNKI